MEVVADEKKCLLEDGGGVHTTQNHVKNTNHTNCGPHVTNVISGDASSGKAYTHNTVNNEYVLLTPECKAIRWTCNKNDNIEKIVAHNNPTAIAK